MKSEIIRTCIKKLGVSAIKLAGVSSVSNVTIGRFLNGKAEPTRGTVVLLAYALLEVCDSEEKETRERLLAIESVRNDIKKELKDNLF